MNTLLVRQTDRRVQLFLALVHVAGLALAVPFFSWVGLWTMIGLYYFTGMCGVTMCYHRLLTHGSFETYPIVRKILTVIGALAGQGPPIKWVTDHRIHHQYSDREGDPHSPHQDGFLFAHMTWLWAYDTRQYSNLCRRYSKDLLKDPFMLSLHKWYAWLHVGSAALLFAVGWLIDGWRIGVSLFVYGYLLRLLVVFHSTWLVNSLSHTHGYQNYKDTGDHSRNNWIVAILAGGEGWHNNHHAEPTAANHGHRWWEIDITHWLVCALESFGLAWSVKRAKNSAGNTS